MDRGVITYLERLTSLLTGVSDELLFSWGRGDNLQYRD